MRKTSVFRIVGHCNIAVDFLLRQFLYNQKQNFPASKKAAKVAKVSKKGLIMIVEFSVTNYCSYADKQTLSFVPKTNDENNIKTSNKTVPELLRSVVIYGPNASGKSNFICALYDFYNTIVGINNLKKLHKPFLLNEHSKNEPTTFEIVLCIDSKLYNYSFSYNNDIVVTETLLCDNKIIFSRENYFFNKENCSVKKPKWFFDPVIQHTCPKDPWNYIDLVSNTETFLKISVERFNCSFLEKVFKHITYIKNIFFYDKVYYFNNYNDFFFNHCKDKPLFKKALKVLNSFGQEIKEIDLIDHNISNGFSLLSYYIISIVYIIEIGGVFIMDEIDQSLHPHVLEYLFFLFQDPNINKNGAQLLTTCNNTSLMSSTHLDPDNIWFVKRNEQFSSVLYPLTDFDIKDDEDIERCYLAGHYGALPYVNYWGCFNN